MGKTWKSAVSMPEWMARDLGLLQTETGERSERMRMLMQDGRAVERAMFQRAVHIEDGEERREFIKEAIDNEVDRRRDTP